MIFEYDVAKQSSKTVLWNIYIYGIMYLSHWFITWLHCPFLFTHGLLPVQEIPYPWGPWDHIISTKFNPLRPRQNGRHFADDTLNLIFLNDVRMWIKISLKFAPKGPINNIPALVQIMAWRRPGNKPLFEPMMVSLLTHIWVTWPQWVNTQNANHAQATAFIFNFWRVVFETIKVLWGEN